MGRVPGSRNGTNKKKVYKKASSLRPFVEFVSTIFIQLKMYALETYEIH